MGSSISFALEADRRPPCRRRCQHGVPSRAAPRARWIRHGVGCRDALTRWRRPGHFPPEPDGGCCDPLSAGSAGAPSSSAGSAGPASPAHGQRSSLWDLPAYHLHAWHCPAAYDRLVLDSGVARMDDRTDCEGTRGSRSASPSAPARGTLGSCSIARLFPCDLSRGSQATTHG